MGGFEESHGGGIVAPVEGGFRILGQQQRQQRDHGFPSRATKT